LSYYNIPITFTGSIYNPTCFEHINKQRIEGKNFAVLLIFNVLQNVLILEANGFIKLIRGTYPYLNEFDMEKYKFD
jgi:hypothetical protein